MALYLSILDNAEAFSEEAKYGADSGLASFKVSKTEDLKRLYIERVQWVTEGGVKVRKPVRIATIDLSTGEVAITNAADAVPDVEAPYIGVFNEN